MVKHNDYEKIIISLIQKLSSKHSTWNVFEDFLEMSAIAISNSVDWVHKTEREEFYMKIIKRYTKEEINIFPELLGNLVNALEDAGRPEDILGRVFHSLELHNKYKGQFFTPQHICDFMGAITADKKDDNNTQKGYISVCEPCAGSGAMILGLAYAMQKNNYNYQQNMVVTAVDIDIKCVHMCYLQLSLFNIPAVVIHGDSLAMKEWSHWYTPAYMLGGWLLKTKTAKTAHPKQSISPQVPPSYDIELSMDKNGQLRFI